MRSPALLLSLCLLTLLPVGLYAQEQEDQLVNRLLRPNQELQFRGFERGFNGSKGFYNHRTPNIRSFYFKERFRARDYLTGSYQGQQSYWRGDFQYRTGDANLTKTESLRRMERGYTTRNAETKTSRDATRSLHDSGRTSRLSGRSTEVKGRSQERYNTEGLTVQHKTGWTGDLHQLKTVQDIRDLLNKDQGKK